MLQLSIAATLAFLCVVYSGPAPSTDAETDTFHIVALQKIEKERNNDDGRVHFLFPQTLEYGVRFSKGTFKLQLIKDESPTNQVHVGHIIAEAQNDEYGNHQFAVYRHTDEHHVVTLECDAPTERCFLTGLIHNEGITWKIDPKEGEPDKYLATQTNTESYKIQDAIREGQFWAFEVAEKLERAHQLALTTGYSTPRRGLRHKRSVVSTCNIVDVVAVGDASVWQFFLARNGDNATLAEAAMRQNYEELFNEVDLIFSCLPEDFCLRVFLRRVVIQTDAATDFAIDIGANVDANASLATCEALREEEDVAHCFTRRSIQVGSDTSGRAHLISDSTCKNNGSPKSAIIEEFNEQLAKLVTLVIILQIDLSISSCTGNTFNVDDRSFTLPTDPADYPKLFAFSNCSQDALRLAIEELNNASSNCLLKGNITDEDFLEQATCRALAGQVIPIDHQCELAYGVGSFACQQVNSSTILCGPGTLCFANGVCDSQQRVYSGTPCGVDKVCFKGECIDEFNCGPLPIVTGGYYVLDTGATILAATATLTCFPGWMTASTPIKIQCKKDGWSDPAENCTLIECDLPATENGTYVAKNNNKFGTLATLMCDHKFTPSTKYTSIVCQADGNYSTPMATCIDNPCPSASWVRQNHSCFLFNAVNRTYRAARDFCQKFDGAFLAQSDSQEKNDFLKNYAANIATPEPAFGYWIGLVQPSLGAPEIWLPSGDAVTFNNWNPGQPSDNPASGAVQQSCTQLRRIFGYAWDDCECDIGIPGEFTVREGFALCEFPINSDCGPLPIVTGGYYVRDTSLTTLYATATLTCFPGWMTSTPIKIQCRKDGWNDPAENCTRIECDLPTAENGTYVAKNNNKFGTLATLMCDHKFTPSTKYTSIVCQADGNYSTPMATCIDNPCPSASWVRQNHSCFLFNAVNRTYRAARDFCQKFDGAFLVQSDSQEKNDFLKNYAANIAMPEPAFGYWIGAVQISLGAPEIWLPSGDLVSFNNWNPGQPSDNPASGAVQQSCTQLRRIFGYAWDDCECDIGIPGEFTVREGFALCEFPINSDCGPLPIVTGGYYVRDTSLTTLYTTATLTCFPGWMTTSTPIKIQCRKDGWNDPAENCTRIECDLPTAENGTYVAKSNNKFGTVATLMCDHKFTPSTKYTSIVCQADGNYSTPMATCIDNPCPSASWVRQNHSCFLFGANNLSYSGALEFCQKFDGAFLAQSDSEEKNDFLKNYAANIARPEPAFGYWIGAVQTSLGAPEIWLPSGDLVSFNNWNPGQPSDNPASGAVQQSCTQLRRIFGYAWDDCECDIGIPGEFTVREGFALCEFPINSDCGPLPIVTGGYYVRDTSLTTLYTTATLTCFPGWMTSTPIKIQCRKDGWNDPAENCTRIECDLPTAENGTYVAKNNNKFGTVATLMCDHKFTPSTKYTSIVCQADGNYSTPMATCIDNPCPSASWVRQNHSCFLFGANNLSYSGALEFCQKFDGAFLAQSDSEEKNDFLKNYAANIARPEPAFGYWIGLAQTALGAPEVWLPSFDTLTFTDWSSNQPNDNVVVSGASQQSCTQLRRIFGYAWDDCECDIGIPGEFTVREGFALCEFPIDSDCGPLPIVTGGYYVRDTSLTTLYATATLICFPGRMTSTPIKIQCRKDGWNDPAENCTRIECGDPPMIDNGMFMRSSNTSGSLARLICDHGFAPSTEATVILCQKDGNYSTPMSSCITNCGIPPRTGNGYYELDSNSTMATLLNATATIQCCTGFNPPTPSQITCTESGWTDPIDCTPCPTSDWVINGTSCYLFDPNERVYSNARDFCEGFGDGTLVSIGDSAENEFLKDYVLNIAMPKPMAPNEGYWIGLTFATNDNTQPELPDGSTATFFDWAPGQPNAGQSCGSLFLGFGINARWADIECSVGNTDADDRTLFAICEFPLE